jgi:glycosyl transferase family 87
MRLLKGRTIELSLNAAERAAKSPPGAIIKDAVCILAVMSLGYAVLTATKVGLDLGMFQIGARAWVDGIFRIGFGPIGEYPPFALPLLSPIAFISIGKLAALFLVINLAATALSLYLVFKLWGSEWPVKPRLYFAAFFLTWAPFRVTLRNGQISLMILALLLGALLARRKKREFLAGALLGLTLAKYSLIFPFVLYFVWRREWKILSTAILIPLVLTEVFALRVGLTIFEAIDQYAHEASGIYLSGVSADMGTSEIKLLFFDLSRGNDSFASILTLSLSIAAMVCMAVVFSRQPRWELAHVSALALFSLWSVYHRVYDSVLCLLPAALFMDLLVRKKYVAFSRFWLAGLGLLIISIPGVLVNRLKMSPATLSNNPLLALGIHIERLLVFGMFWSLLFLMWKARDISESPEHKLVDDGDETIASLTTGPKSLRRRARA